MSGVTATAPIAVQAAGPPVADGRAREVFAARDARRVSAVTTWRRRLSWPLGIYTTPAAILILWEILADAKVIGPTVGPAPSVIVRTAVDLWKQGVLGPDLATSLRRAAVGFLLGVAVGIVTGTFAGLARAGENLFNGIVVVFNTIPILALLPLFIVWFGIGELSKVLIIAFGAFLPMYLNLFAGIRDVDQRLVEMARVNNAGAARLVARVLVPGALPGFLTGLRFSLAFSILGLVAAETINATQGLGFMISQAEDYLQTNNVFVGLVIYSILGLLADQLVRLLSRVLLRWRPSYEAK